VCNNPSSNDKRGALCRIFREPYESLKNLLGDNDHLSIKDVDHIRVPRKLDGTLKLALSAVLQPCLGYRFQDLLRSLSQIAWFGLTAHRRAHCLSNMDNAQLRKAGTLMNFCVLFVNNLKNLMIIGD
jgi:hypothetical protein